MSEERTNWCRHHRSPKPLDHECAIGVDIGAILPRNTFGHHYAMPCNTATSENTPKCTCDKRDLFTAAEVAQQDADSEAAMAEAKKRLLATLPLIERLKKEHADRHGASHRKHNSSGREDCPVCGSRIAWSLVGFNMHIAMRCSTQDCIAFIE